MNGLLFYAPLNDDNPKFLSYWNPNAVTDPAAGGVSLEPIGPAANFNGAQWESFYASPIPSITGAFGTGGNKGAYRVSSKVGRG